MPVLGFWVSQINCTEAAWLAETIQQESAKMLGLIRMIQSLNQLEWLPVVSFGEYSPNCVITAKAGIYPGISTMPLRQWVPAFAGMTQLIEHSHFEFKPGIRPFGPTPRLPCYASVKSKSSNSFITALLSLCCVVGKNNDNAVVAPGTVQACERFSL